MVFKSVSGICGCQARSIPDDDSMVVSRRPPASSAPRTPICGLGAASSIDTVRVLSSRPSRRRRAGI
jgi:hypothetical protein